jgi:L-seryl-tRNA(Ser) seleniumtransferase
VATRVACIGDVRVEDEAAQVGSGSVPAQSMPTKVLAIRPSSVTATELAKRLRLHRPPVFARISKDAVLLDFRTIQPGEDEIVAKAVAEAMKQ